MFVCAKIHKKKTKNKLLHAKVINNFVKIFHQRKKAYHKATKTNNLMPKRYFKQRNTYLPNFIKNPHFYIQLSTQKQHFYKKSMQNLCF